ncbi:DUF2059 domain-containing protein [Marinobacter sp. 2_MG-2023]|uniref:DUF2059 domain-containing protein n=1 Tax=Marinobacter sp. 2_MG-2023 TaxID=3062679 RepID=UPI0026E12534|nr:DUF2059 domain-containing protein [Marinobacter sp. 2_MG-2023]MDO6442691.1 DUF2059 domain-containing protein [Marinobacter sp. 2_MG-2023]
MKLGTLVKPLLITGLFLAGPVMATPSAQQVLDASPIDDIVDRYPAMMSEGIREGMKRSQQLPPMVADTIGYVVTNSFRAADIEQEIVNNLERDLSGKQLEAVESWYTTPVAQKISAAEIAASDPVVWKQIQARASDLNEKYKGTDRAKMFERFDRAARATESTVDTTIAVQLGLATAMAAFSSDSVNYDELKQSIENQRGKIRGIVEQQVYDSYLHTYENISSQEMGLYIDFLESGPGTAFSKTVTQSIQQAITDPIESIGNQMARFLAPQK